MKHTCAECGQPLSFRNEFVVEGRHLCRDCFSRTNPRQGAQPRTQKGVAAGVFLVIAAFILTIAQLDAGWSWLDGPAVVLCVVAAVMAFARRALGVALVLSCVAFVLPVVSTLVRIPGWSRYGITVGNITWAVEAGLTFVLALAGFLLLRAAMKAAPGAPAKVMD